MSELEEMPCLSLADYCSSITDGDHQAPPKSDHGIPFITISAMNDGSLDLTKASRFVPQSYYDSLHPARRAQCGDLLYSVTGSFGIPAPVVENNPFVFQRHIALLRPRVELCDFRWLTYILASPQLFRQSSNIATGTAQLTVPLTGLRNLKLPAVGLPEQRRIVAKIDSLTGKSKRARDHLDHIPRLVEKYKQAILAAAFRGDLTRDWRAAHNDELAGPINIHDLKLDDSERGQWPTDRLPDQWEWRPFRATFSDLTDSKRKLPQKDYLAEGKFPVIDQGEAQIGGYSDRDDLVHPAEPPFILFGDHTRCVKFVTVRFIQGADGVKVLHTCGDVLPAYARLALVAVDLPDKGYSRHMKFVRATVFPIAPTSEQAEIVRRIEAAFTWINRLAADATSARKLIDHLDQAVLAKAFQGELVPQDPDDEPASVLLERIRAEREAAPRAKRGRKKAA